MATYGLRYQSDFYNYFSKLVSIKIYKQDYSDSIEDDLRLQEVIITTNYQNDNTPIIGRGAKVVIIADNTDMGYLQDMLLSYERQFLCVIEYDSVVVFRGYSLCDLNERQLLPYATVTIEFTDYMRRLEGKYPDVLSDYGGRATVYQLIEEILGLTNLDLPLYVNSTLFEDDMNSAATDTFLPQVYVQNANFYSNSYDYDNIYDAINKALQPFSAFIYSCNDKWIIERQEDITRDGNWVMYSAGVATEVGSLKQEIYKQGSAGENFEYVDCSQIIEYDSGLKTLILSLKDKKLDTLVFNNYTSDMLSVADATPDAGTLEQHTWYKYSTMPAPTVGENYEDLTTWVRFTSDSYARGLCYNFLVQFNGFTDMDSSGASTDNPTILTVDYTMSTDQSIANWFGVKVRFLLRLDGGEYSDWWLQSALSISGEQQLYLYPPTAAGYAWESADPANFCINTTTIDVTEGDINWSISKTFNLTDRPIRNMQIAQDFDSLWDILDFPKYQKFTIIFLPLWYSDEEANWFNAHNPTELVSNNYLGNVQVLVSAEDINNRIEYHLNQDFVKTDEIDLYLFDLDNFNYSNGLLGADQETLTNLWTSENSAVACPLYEVFAKGKFRKYGRTIHRLKGKILIDEVIKPFALLTDDTILNESDEVITFLVNGFSWDLNAGTYDIEAEEYTEEEIIVDGVTYDSAGEQEGEDVAPETPTGVIANQLVHRGTILVDWNAVSNAIGYKLQRMPYYSGGVWVAAYKIVYIGTATYFHDAVAAEGDPTGETFYYKVCSYNAAGDSAYSDPPVEVVWT
jgi:hypothetical protein